jgi:hypothetical protein
MPVKNSLKRRMYMMEKYELRYSSNGRRVADNIEAVQMPYIVELNLDETVFYPKQGERQRFCYEITGNGKDEKDDLKIVLLCANEVFSQEEIAYIEVYMDGAKQEISFDPGGNVEILQRSEENPFPNPAGIRITLPLKSTQGCLKVCFELAQPRLIGSSDILLVGKDEKVCVRRVCGPVGDAGAMGYATGFQDATVCVPVTLTPYVKTGDMVAVNCSPPQIARYACALHVPEESATFTVIQDVRIAVPIQVGVTISSERPTIRLWDDVKCMEKAEKAALNTKRKNPCDD